MEAYSLLSVTEAAAVSIYDWIGRNNEFEADKAAVDAMRNKLNTMPFSARIAIGEGERDKAPMLFIGEIVGAHRGASLSKFTANKNMQVSLESQNLYKNLSTKSTQQSEFNPKSSSIEFDIAVDPLDGTKLTAKMQPEAVSLIACTEYGGMLCAPDIYMSKIAIGSHIGNDVIDLDLKPKQNVINLAKAKNTKPSALTVAILDRERHSAIIESVLETGAKVKLITDGDVMAAIATCLPESGIDMYIGIGGAPEGVLAAAAIKCMGGQMQGRLLVNNDEEENRAYAMGLNDIERKYNCCDMISGNNVIFISTGITDGSILNGVKKLDDGFLVNSLILSYHNQYPTIIKRFVRK